MPSLKPPSNHQLPVSPAPPTGSGCRAILLKRFMQPATPPDDAYAHVGSIVTNLTRLKEARCVLLQPGRGLLSALQVMSLPPVGCPGCHMLHLQNVMPCVMASHV